MQIISISKNNSPHTNCMGATYIYKRRLLTLKLYSKNQTKTNVCARAYVHAHVACVRVCYRVRTEAVRVAATARAYLCWLLITRHGMPTCFSRSLTRSSLPYLPRSLPRALAPSLPSCGHVPARPIRCRLGHPLRSIQADGSHTGDAQLTKALCVL